MTEKLQGFGIGLIGASTGIYADRIGGFAGAVKEYQHTLMAYRSALKSNSATKAVAKQAAQAAFDKMQLQFRLELNSVNGQVKARRGTPLTSVQRATNIAESSRNVVALHVSSQAQATNLVKFTQQAKFLGNGLAVIDFGSRIGNIQNSYEAGGNWERELFIESSSFALSATAGIVAANAATAMLGFFVVATPIGWVGLIIGGVAVAGFAAVTSIGVNSIAKEKSGLAYDQLMEKIL